MNNKMLLGGVAGLAAVVTLAGCNAPAPAKGAVSLTRLVQKPPRPSRI
jgi:hypothetical protein